MLWNYVVKNSRKMLWNSEKCHENCSNFASVYWKLYLGYNHRRNENACEPLDVVDSHGRSEAYFRLTCRGGSTNVLTISDQKESQIQMAFILLLLSLKNRSQLLVYDHTCVFAVLYGAVQYGIRTPYLFYLTHFIRVELEWKDKKWLIFSRPVFVPLSHWVQN